MSCEPVVLNVGGCNDIDVHVSNVSYDAGTSILTIVLNDGTVYQTPISIPLDISLHENNQVQLLVDGIYVPIPTFGVNGLEYYNGNNLSITNDDSTVAITATKSGNTITLNLSSHQELSVNSMQPYNFDVSTQTLSIPLPSLVYNGQNVYTYNAGDGSADIVFSTDVCSKLPECSLSELGDIDTTGVEVNNILAWNGTTWIPTIQSATGTTTLIDNGDGTYSFSDGTNTTIIYTASNKNNPFALEGGGQQTRMTDLPITASVYRVGNTGFGISQSDSVLGKVEVRGDEYISNTGSEASLYFKPNVNGASESLQTSLTTNTSGYQFRVKDINQSLLSIDKNGNTGIGEVQNLMNLPEYTFNSNSSLVISNYNNDMPPTVPLSAYSVATFVLIV